MSECEQKKRPMAAIPVINNKAHCEKICTYEYNPVCAFNGHEFLNYGNMCGFEIANCEADFSQYFKIVKLK